jgi:hypothetical protein
MHTMIVAAAADNALPANVGADDERANDRYSKRNFLRD